MLELTVRVMVYSGIILMSNTEPTQCCSGAYLNQRDNPLVSCIEVASQWYEVHWIADAIHASLVGILS